MKRILACLILLLALAAMPMKADAASLPKDAVFLWNTGKIAFYMRPYEKHLVDYGWYFTVEQITVPIGEEHVKRFRDATGKEPGYMVNTCALKVSEPKLQIVKMVFVPEGGLDITHNFGLADTWDEVKPGTPMHALWSLIAQRLSSNR